MATIFSEFSDDNCQSPNQSANYVNWNHGWNDDRITSKGYRYMYYTTTYNPWHKHDNINSYRTQADPTKSSIR